MKIVVIGGNELIGKKVVNNLRQQGHEVLAAFGVLARTAIDTAGKAGDADTADPFTEVSRGVDKLLWLVEGTRAIQGLKPSSRFSTADITLISFSSRREVTHGKVNKRADAGGQDSLSGIDHVNWQVLGFPLWQNLCQVSRVEFILDQPIWQQGDAQSVPHRFAYTGNALGNQHGRNAQRLFGPIATEEREFLGAPELRPHDRNPRPRFEVGQCFDGRPALDEGGRSRQMQRDHTRRAGNDTFVSDFTRQDSDIATFLDHLQRTIAQRQGRGDLGILLQELTGERRDHPLPYIKRRKQTQMTAQRRVILMQPPVRFFRVSQDGFGIGEQPLPRLCHVHPMRVPPQQRRAAQLLQRPQLPAQSGLRNPQAPRTGGNAAAFHNAN